MFRPAAMPMAQRTDLVSSFRAMALLARAQDMQAQGRDVIHMEVGEPDFPTPPLIAAAAQQALSTQRVGYTVATGTPALRAKIAHYYRDTFAVEVDPVRIIITPGASGALLLALTAIVNAGEHVLLPDPSYPANRNLVNIVGGQPSAVTTTEESGFQLNATDCARAWLPNTVALLVASPANPTGAVLSLQTMQNLHACVSERAGAFIVDEIYQGLIYDGVPTSALAISDDIFVVNSFSKFFNMTGWRLGWLVAPPQYVDALTRLVQNMFLAPSTLAQYAALAAFDPATLALLEQRRSELAARRDYLVPALRALGFRVSSMPAGAFYVYADCSGLTNDAHTFAEALLQETAVAVTPGLDFGSHRAHEFIRFAYTTPIARLQEAVARLGRFIGR